MPFQGIIYSMPVPSQTIEKDCPKIYSGGYYQQDPELASKRQMVLFLGTLSILVGYALMYSSDEDAEVTTIQSIGAVLLAGGFVAVVYAGEFMSSITSYDDK